ncbi:hypothetical protein HGO37_06070 [Rhizobium sp. CG4]|jgi:hypothetical protein|uniref:hypothetical protein n=1 Tax=Rhizobium sp. CG4 TaxID=2726075 RepID=UPI0020347277|nr:hypothetical protein [Rhizobium sp. CG4]MCM2454951.1 hypothetical protein [Rhizobium sp. CG4]
MSGAVKREIVLVNMDRKALFLPEKKKRPAEKAGLTVSTIATGDIRVRGANHRALPTVYARAIRDGLGVHATHDEGSNRFYGPILARNAAVRRVGNNRGASSNSLARKHSRLFGQLTPLAQMAA